jgi:hypothetical protein
MTNIKEIIQKIFYIYQVVMLDLLQLFSSVNWSATIANTPFNVKGSLNFHRFVFKKILSATLFFYTLRNFIYYPVGFWYHFQVRVTYQWKVIHAFTKKIYIRIVFFDLKTRVFG